MENFEMYLRFGHKKPKGPAQMFWKASGRLDSGAMQYGLSRTWDVTVVEILTNSFISHTSVAPCEAAEAS